MYMFYKYAASSELYAALWNGNLYGSTGDTFFGDKINIITNK